MRPLMQAKYAIASSAVFACLGCALAPMAQAQASHCLSDINVRTKLMASVRSALRSPSVPEKIAAKADSLIWLSSDSLCAVAVSAFNANAVDSVSAVYVIEVPGDSYVVMPESTDGKLLEYTWYTINWSDPVVMTP